MMSNERHTALAAMMVRNEKGSFVPLLECLSEENKAVVEKTVDHLKGSDNPVRAAQMQIKRLLAKREFNDLQNIHPGWILQFLKKESPRVVGIILRYLPSRQVRYIVQQLPPSVRDNLPHMVESFAVRPPILELIKHKFLDKFDFATEDLDGVFSQVFNLNGDELNLLCRELGIIELALAISGLSKTSLRVLYNRLKFSEAKKLKRRVYEFEGESDILKRQARFAILSLDLKEDVQEDLAHELGLLYLARSILPSRANELNLIAQKMEPQSGYKLLRWSREFGVKSDEKLVERRKEILEKVLKELKEETLTRGC